MSDTEPERMSDPNREAVGQPPAGGETAPDPNVVPGTEVETEVETERKRTKRDRDDDAEDDDEST
ncbi:MAG TPA: hypothetical protein VJM33_13285 [Microthrixaceae bacterium]|nr:hypothetical protein [Microthrixaceae bacterium]